MNENEENVQVEENNQENTENNTDISTLNEALTELYAYDYQYYDKVLEDLTYMQVQNDDILKNQEMIISQNNNFTNQFNFISFMLSLFLVLSIIRNMVK